MIAGSPGFVVLICLPSCRKTKPRTPGPAVMEKITPSVSDCCHNIWSIHYNSFHSIQSIGASIAKHGSEGRGRSEGSEIPAKVSWL